MKTLPFGYPPPGESAELSTRGAKISSSLREAIAREFEALYPGVYILAAFDPETDTLALYHRTREDCVARSRIDQIVLTPTEPAKGPGFIEIGWMNDSDPFPSGTIWTSSYSSAMHDWMRVKAMALASLAGCRFRETQVYKDC
jgi:hypothetical protein